MLGVLFLGFGAAAITGACGGPVSPNQDQTTPSDTETECAAETETPCKRYRIELVGDLTKVALRDDYIAAFGSACYLSEATTFDCWYRTWKKACEDAVEIGDVSKNAPYDRGYKCQPVGNGDYTLQIGSNVSNVTRIHFADAPRQTPLIDINGVSTAVNGPYRNLPEPQVVGPGELFRKEQRALILKANRGANGEKIRSDLAGFVYACDKTDPTKMCTEPDFLIEGSPNDADAAQVHHVTRARDKRCCPWGTNSNSNAAVISRKLNIWLTNDNPTAGEVALINQISPYTP